MILNSYFFILLLAFQYSSAQNTKFYIPDSIKSKDCAYFSNHITPKAVDSTKSLFYAKCWLEKAKLEKGHSQLPLAYKAMLHNSAKKYALQYADSLILAAKQTHDNTIIGSAYMTRGIVYYDKKRLKEALDDYLIADEYVSKTDDSYSIHKIKFLIGLTKYYLGFYHEAIALLKECVSYFEDENERGYLNSMHALGLCYNKIGDYDACSAMNRKGIAIGREIDEPIMEPYFLLSEGVNHNSRRHFEKAIKQLEEVMPQLSKNKDFASESVANFYIADSYWALRQESKAIPFLNKVDAVFAKEKYIRPDLRRNYELLIDYYKSQNNKEQQLYFIERLLQVDSILNSDYKYLSATIFKQYDTKKLQKAKADIEHEMVIQKITHLTVIAILLILVLWLIRRHYKLKKLYRQRYEELMNRQPEIVSTVPKAIKDAELEISPEIVSAFLKNLDKFESKKKFLDKDMTVVKFAAIMHTNPKYASKIILHYRRKRFIEYISDLKIDHIVELLKTQNKYRNYTNKALGEEAGFGSTQNFTRAFKTRNGISPTYFIQELQKEF